MFVVVVLFCTEPCVVCTDPAPFTPLLPRRIGCDGMRGLVCVCDEPAGEQSFPLPGEVSVGDSSLCRGFDVGIVTGVGGFPNRRPMVPSPKSHEGALLPFGGVGINVESRGESRV